MKPSGLFEMLAIFVLLAFFVSACAAPAANTPTISTPRLLYRARKQPNKSTECYLQKTWYVGRIDQTDEQLVIGCGSDATVAPNGKELAFSVSCWPVGSSCVKLVRTDGSALLQTSWAVGYPDDWSPDGCHLVGTNPANSRIFVMNADGSNYRELARGENPRWMPDGQQIRFKQDTDIHLIRADGTEDRVLPHDPLYGAVSPDAKLVAYEVQPEHSLSIYDVQSGTTTPIGTGWGADWSPDSKRLIYEDAKGVGRVLTIVNADGSGRFVLPVEGIYPEWSPDGTMIAYDTSWTDDGMVHVINADGTGDRALYHGMWPHWIPVAQDTVCE